MIDSLKDKTMSKYTAALRRAKLTSKQRTARKKKKGEQESRNPGYLSPAMRRRMGDALADIFDNYGPEIFGDIELKLKDTLKKAFTNGINDVKKSIKEELGNRGVEESVQYFGEWINGVVEDITHFGMDNAAGALEDLASSLAAEYVQDEGGEGEELFEVSSDDVETVEEVDEDAIEPVEDEESLEDMFAEEEGV
jgi:hypothetical protein